MTYPSFTKPFNHGFLKVSDLHEIYYEEVGKPDGQPAVFLHGGPGEGCQPKHRTLHDPTHYRLILPDQRGCGRSTFGELKENTTWDLISDLEALRAFLKLEKWQVLGTSWGSTLAVAYAQAHPERVEGLVLQGWFPLTRKTLDFIFQGGAGDIRPEAYERFVGHVGEEERGDLLGAYHARMFSGDEEVVKSAVREWGRWQMSCSKLKVDEGKILAFEEAPMDVLTVAMERHCCHYLYNLGWLRDGQLLEPAEIDKIRGIPCVVVHGRYDLLSPVSNVWELKRAWPELRVEVVECAGHSGREEGVGELMTKLVDSMKVVD